LTRGHAKETLKSESNQTVRVGAHLVEQGATIAGRYKITSMLWPQLFNTKYPKHQHIRSGNYGAAYLALDKDTNQAVVVKLYFRAADDHSLLTVENAGDDDAAKRRLKYAARECEVANSIPELQAAAQYPNGAARWMRCLHNGIKSKVAAYVVFEYLGKTNLEELADTDEFTNDDMLRIAKQMLEGLALVQGTLVHRDIKAANIMAYRDSTRSMLYIVFVDFGFVVNVGDDQAENAGSPNTMAPEAYDGDYIPQSAFDVYSVGAVLFQLLCGRTLYDDVCDQIEKDDEDAKRSTDQSLMSEDETMEAAEELIQDGKVNIDSFCSDGIPEDKAELYRYVVDHMLVPDPEQRASARLMLKDDIFKDVSTE